MFFKRFIILFFILVVGLSPLYSGTKEFQKGNFFLTPQLGINTYAIPLGLNAEYAITENIGVGGTGMLWFWSSDFWSNTVIAISADAAYHFTGLKVEKLDVYAGGGLGINLYSWKWKNEFSNMAAGGVGSTGVFLQPFVGARYYITPKLAINLRVNVAFLGNWTGVGGVLGVSIPLPTK